MSDEHELTRLRLLLGISMSELDRRAGVPVGTTHDIVSGRNQKPSHEITTLITRALQRSGLKGITAEQVFPVAESGEPPLEPAVAS